MNDRIARLAVLLGLIPAIVGLIVSIMSIRSELSVFIGPLTPVVRSFEQFALVIASSVMVVVLVVLWRRYVRWTPGRSTTTAAATALLLGQVLLWHPICKVQGCGQNEILMVGQSAATAGVWCIGCSLTWWSFAIRRRRGRDAPLRSEGKKLMTPDVARIACGMALFPLLFGLWWMTAVCLHEVVFPNSRPWPEYLALELISLVAVAVWFVLWRTRVQWSRVRRMMTLILALALLIAPAHMFFPNASDIGWTGLAAAILESAKYAMWLFALGLWFMGTAWLWRSSQEFAVRADEPPDIRCPQCNYCLTGLREVRCPECNWSSTVDEIARLTLAAAAT